MMINYYSKFLRIFLHLILLTINLFFKKDKDRVQLAY